MSAKSIAKGGRINADTMQKFSGFQQSCASVHHILSRNT